MTAILIPAYCPGPALARTVADLRAARPGLPVLVVDDGSGPAYGAAVRAAVAAGADLLTLPANGGKGAALKAGFAHLRATRPGESVVCADADGQHAVGDILTVADALEGPSPSGADRLVLGTRAFGGDVPLRSRVGNTATRWLFRAATGQRLVDTQTGLRGCPAGLLPWLESVDGDRYEFELRVLLRAARAGIALETVPIATIYLDDNSSSHFRPVADSLRVYGPLLGFLASSLAAFVIDAAVLLAAYSLTGALLASVLLARLVSASVNFAVNRRLVFARGRSTPTGRAARGYAVLATGILAANYLMLRGLTDLGLTLLPAKVLTEAALVTVSYLVQQRLVFTGSPSRAGGRGGAGHTPSQRAHRDVEVVGQSRPTR
ncbi:MAG: bifunctional glycosyltransferase family 2/GtrA family protein [Nocardioidaceae bacterium]